MRTDPMNSHVLTRGTPPTFVLEASTNLVDWKPICVVRPDAEGSCEYEGLMAPNHQSRFYRVVKP